MGKQVSQLRQVREGLAFAPTEQATSFGGIADRWLALLETAQRALQEQAAQTAEIPQVYVAGSALRPDQAGGLFKGRVDLFRQLEALMLRPVHPTLLLYGGRRTGKTSTLNYLPYRLDGNLIPLLVDLQAMGALLTWKGFVRELVDQISESARGGRNLHLPPLDQAWLEEDPFVALRRWMDAVEKTSGARTLLLCLDEYERLDEFATHIGNQAPFHFLRHVMQHRPRWTLLFAGAHFPDELPTHWSDYLINTQAVRVSALSEADSRDLILHPMPDFPPIYAPETVDGIWKLTRGHPYLIQLLCNELVDRLNREKRKLALPTDIEDVLPAVFDRGGQFFREFWELTLTPAQQQLLAALAQQHPLPAPSSADLEILRRKEFVVVQHGLYGFQTPLLRRWVEWRLQRDDEFA